MMPTLWEYMSFGGFLGALRAQGWEMYIFGHFLLISIFVLKVACPQSRMSSKSCPQRRCPQRRLSSMSHRD